MLKQLDESKELFSRMITFVEHFSKLHSNIEQLNSNYNKMVGSWHLRVEPSLRKIENLGVKLNKDIPQIDELDSSSKDLSD
jgi:DNA anti-recombination protein RmuC